MRVNRLKINVSERWGVGLRHKGLEVDSVGTGFSAYNGSNNFLTQAMKWYRTEIYDNLNFGNPELTKEYYENW